MVTKLVDNKVRLRTYNELKTREREFLKICDILDKIKIKHFLKNGVLLGAVREKNFIKWDWDVEISVFTKDFLPKIDNIVSLLKKNNFKILNVVNRKNDAKISFYGVYPKNVTAYCIWSWNYSKRKDIYWRKELSVPSKFLKKLSKIEFLGRKFNCPDNPKKYLSWVYGNWQIPLQSSNKDLYLTNNFRNKKKIKLTELKNKFIKFIFYILSLFRLIRSIK